MRHIKALVLLAASTLVACGSGGSDGGGGGGQTVGGGGGGAAACSSSNCTGCCLNNVCQSGNTAAGCGKNGIACVACGNNQVCRSDQLCGVDPNSTWRVQPVSASIAANNNGTSWDGDSSAPDVVVQMRCPPSTASNGTTSEVSSYSPSWTSGGCTSKASDLLASPWGYQLFDIDALADDTITGALTHQFKETDFVAGSVSLPASGGLQSMTVQLIKQ